MPGGERVYVGYTEEKPQTILLVSEKGRDVNIVCVLTIAEGTCLCVVDCFHNAVSDCQFFHCIVPGCHVISSKQSTTDLQH